MIKNNDDIKCFKCSLQTWVFLHEQTKTTLCNSLYLNNIMKICIGEKYLVSLTKTMMWHHEEKRRKWERKNVKETEKTS